MMMPHIDQKRYRGFDQMIKKVGLKANLQMCWDWGSRRSYPGTGNVIFDLSGNGYHMAGQTATPPGFAGTPGIESANETGTFNGSNYWQLASGANDAFIDGMHKIGGNFEVVGIGYGATPWMIGTQADNDNSRGWQLTFTSITGGAGIYNNVGNGGANNVGGISTTPDRTTASGLPNFCASGRNIIANNNRATNYYTNGTYEGPANATNSFTPGSGAAAQPLRIGATGSVSFAPATCRPCALAVFNRMLTQAELDALRALAMKRWTAL